MDNLHAGSVVPGGGLANPAPVGFDRLGRFRFWPPAARTARQFRALDGNVQVAAIGLSAAVVLASAVGWRIDSSVTETLLAQAAARATDHVELAVRDHVTAADFVPPYTQAKLDELSTRLNPLLARARQKDSAVLRVNLFARDGTIVYSDVAGLRGQAVSPVDDVPLAQALAGSVGADISALATAENAGLRPFSDSVLEAYVPFRLDGQVVAAYELYIDLTPIRPTRLLMGATVAAGFLACVVLVLVAARAIPGRARRPEWLAAAEPSAGQAAPDGGVAVFSAESARDLHLAALPLPAVLNGVGGIGWSLTKREAEVLRLMATNRSYAQIAADLVVSEETVRTHVRSIFHKLGQRDRAHAVAAAADAGIL